LQFQVVPDDNTLVGNEVFGVLCVCSRGSKLVSDSSTVVVDILVLEEKVVKGIREQGVGVVIHESTYTQGINFRES
jgi:hypothetical protein